MRFIGKMFANTAGMANRLAQFSCAQYAISQPLSRLHPPGMTGFALIAQLGHIANHHHAIAGISDNTCTAAVIEPTFAL